MSGFTPLPGDGLCGCGHPEDDHTESYPDPDGFFFVTCDVRGCKCLKEYSGFDA